MPCHLAFLRAVNVGGRSVVNMQYPRASFEAAAAVDVNIYLRGGHVILPVKKRRLPAIVRHSEAAGGNGGLDHSRNLMNEVFSIATFRVTVLQGISASKLRPRAMRHDSCVVRLQSTLACQGEPKLVPGVESDCN
jgi:hypothetical protein